MDATTSGRKRRLKLPFFQSTQKNGASSSSLSRLKVSHDGETFSSNKPDFHEQESEATGCGLVAGKQSFDDESPSPANDDDGADWSFLCEDDAKNEESEQEQDQADESFRESFYKSGTDWACLYEIDAYGMPRETSDRTINKHPRLDPGSNLVQTKLASFWSRKSPAANGLKNEQEKGPEIASAAAKFWAKFKQPKAVVVLPVINGSAPPPTLHGSKGADLNPGSQADFKGAGKRHPRAATAKSCPFYKWIAGTSFTVDAFRYGAVQGCSAYFLTHFHYDHYGGLTKSWAHGPIYCTPVTARLVVQCLYVDPRWIHPIPFDTALVMEGVEVKMLDANHCPGAAIIMFQLKDGRLILHTGDFRASKQLHTYPDLVSKHINTLYLDTTYCNPRYRFPPQENVISFVVEITRAALKRNSKTLVVVGAYSIGKERVFLGIAEALGVEIFVEKRRNKILSSLDWPELSCRLCTDPGRTNLHVLPIGSLQAKKLNAYLQGLPRFTSILAFRPTGWTFSESIGEELHMLKPTVSGAVTTYGVPYSEHSSFIELQDFVKFLRPDKIIPTVNVGRADERERMQSLFRQWLGLVNSNMCS